MWCLIDIKIYSIGFLFFGRCDVYFLQYSTNVSYNKLVTSLYLSAGNIAQGRDYQVCQEAGDVNTQS